jgi:hypothetical protein
MIAHAWLAPMRHLGVPRLRFALRGPSLDAGLRDLRHAAEQARHAR